MRGSPQLWFDRLIQLDFFAQLKAPDAREAVRVPRGLSAPLPDIATWKALARGWLREVGAHRLAARIDVRWNKRMRSCAGTASIGRSVVALNPLLAEYGREEVERTLKHELAHLLAHERAGRRRIAAHGAEWRQACADLGVPNEKRCHDLPLPQRKLLRAHRYRCPSCKVELLRVRAFRRKTACLACCRAYARGDYDDRFRFVKVPASRGESLPSGGTVPGIFRGKTS